MTFDERAQGNHLALQVADLEPVDVFGLEPEPLIGLNPHLVGPAEQVEVVDVGRPECRLERAEDHVERNVQALGLDPVDVGVKLGDAGAKRRVQRLEAGLGVSRLDHLVGDLLELGQPHTAAVLELKLEAAGHSEALDRRWREGEDDRLLDLLKPASQLGQDRILAELGRGSFLVGRPPHVQERGVRGVGLVEHRHDRRS